MKRLLSFFLLLVVCVPLLFTSSSDVSAQTKAPTPAFTFFNSGDGAGGRIVYKDVEPGESLTGILRVSLLDDVPTVFSISFRDSARRRIEEIAVSKEDLNKLSVARWLTFPTGQNIVLDGLELFELPYVLNIPVGAAPGDYSGLFMASILDYGEHIDAAKGIDAVPAKEMGMGTNITIGVAIEMLLRVVGDLYPNLEYLDLGYFIEENGQLSLKIKYKNNGNVALSPNAHVLISNIFGRRYYNSDFRFSVISPGTEGESVVKVSLDDFFMGYGIFDVDIDLTYDVFAASAGDFVYSSGSGRLRIYSIPWFVFVVGVGLLVIILLWIFIRNFIFIRLYKSSKEYTVKDRDTLQSVSNKYKVAPKKIILVNKLKKPFFLEKGRKLLIPNQKTKNEKK